MGTKMFDEVRELVVEKGLAELAGEMFGGGEIGIHGLVPSELALRVAVRCGAVRCRALAGYDTENISDRIKWVKKSFSIKW